MCFVFVWEQTATCATYSINWLVFITEMKSVYCAVRTGPLTKAVFSPCHELHLPQDTTDDWQLLIPDCGNVRLRMRTGWLCSALWHGLSPTLPERLKIIMENVLAGACRTACISVGLPYLVTTYRAGFCRHGHLCCVVRPHTFLLISTTATVSCRKRSHVLASQKAGVVLHVDGYIAINWQLRQFITERKTLKDYTLLFVIAIYKVTFRTF